jgi:hypothetical protein
MTKATRIIITLIAVHSLLAVNALADTLVLKSGERVSGYFEGGSARVIKFRTNDGVLKDYDLLYVQQIQFGEDKVSAAPSAQTSTPTPASTSSSAQSRSTSSGEPRLLEGSERVTHPSSSNAAATGWTIPTGTKLVIRMVDSVNSERNKLGDTFIATLEEPLVQNNIEVVPRGADVRGRIANINEAGRVAGAAQLGLELTQLIVNGIPYSLTTSEYEEVGKSRGGQTAKRAAGGAAIGAVIGAIAGGGKGAAIGAGVGGGGATAIQVMTKGEKLNIPSETELEFTLRAPLVVAAK